MKNKKGFTLVEIIATILILALLSLIAGISINAISDRVKTKSFCAKVQTIESAAMQYGEDNKGTINSGILVNVSELNNYGYIKLDDGGGIKDPRNGESMFAKEISVFIKYNRVYAEYQYDNVEDKEACN